MPPTPREKIPRHLAWPRSLRKPLARPLGRLLDRFGRLLEGLRSILGRIGGFAGGCEAPDPESERFQYILLKIRVPSWNAKNMIFNMKIEKLGFQDDVQNRNDSEGISKAKNKDFVTAVTSQNEAPAEAP